MPAPRYVEHRPSDIHVARPKPWHRYAHHVRVLPARLGALAQLLPREPGARILDYGCAEVPYRHFFPLDADYVPADLDGNPHATLHLNEDGTVPAEEGSFDAVISTQVLEHVLDPGLYLTECFRVLRPGGRLLLSTHGVFVYHPDPDDYWRWTVAGLQKAIVDAGLRIVRFEGIVGGLPTGLQLVQDSIIWHIPAWLRAPFALVMQTLVRLTDRLYDDETRKLDSQVYALVAEKP